MTKLKIIDGGITAPGPLGTEGARLWAAVQAEYAVADVGGIELLFRACQAADAIADYDAQIRRDGAVLRLKTGAVRDHPLVKARLAERAFLTRTIQRLGLNFEVVKPVGRPGIGGYTG